VNIKWRTFGSKSDKGVLFWFLIHACDRECGGDWFCDKRSDMLKIGQVVEKVNCRQGDYKENVKNPNHAIPHF
jgi:hypothetical protein